MQVKGIDEDVFKLMVQSRAVREVVVLRTGAPQSKWTVAVRIGAEGTQLIPLRSRREPVRTWASLTAVERFAERMGLEQFAVELHARSSTPRTEAQPIL